MFPAWTVPPQIINGFSVVLQTSLVVRNNLGIRFDVYMACLRGYIQHPHWQQSLLPYSNLKEIPPLLTRLETGLL